MEFYAHTQGNDKNDWQTLKDHLTAVADMSRAFAERFGAGETRVYGGDSTARKKNEGISGKK